MAGRVLTASLSLNSLLALGLSKMPLSVCVCVCCFFLNFIILFFPFLSACPPVSLYTSDEQVVASKQTPVQKSQEKRQPARSTETDTCTSNLTDESD